jgi:uncharacterized protein (TIGR02271 family)
MSMEGHNTENTDDNLQFGDNRKIPVIQEKLVVTKELIETGKVLISKQVLEEEALLEVSISHDEVLVERKIINQYVDSVPPAVRQEGDVTIVSVVKEVLVVEKRLMLVEEIHIRKEQLHENTTISETLRKEEITINRNTSGTEI